MLRYKCWLGMLTQMIFVYAGVFAQTTDIQVKDARPNIIVFLVDDMGWQDCAVPLWNRVTEKNRLYQTPNMVRLANEGMKFTNAYATPVCTPSRVSLITGMNATRHRVTNWTSVNANETSDSPDTILSSVPWNKNGLSPIKGVPGTIYSTALPQILKNNGYYTIHCGKAHFASANTPGENPLNLGFDINIGGHAAGQPGSYLGEKNYGNAENGKRNMHGVPGLEKYYGTSTFLTEALTREAIGALQKPVKNRQPFFLYMSHYAIHIPYAADPRFFEKYLQQGIDSTEAKYAALVEGMDKSLGDLMEFVKQNNIEDNTIILFMSDNGGYGLAPPRTGKPQTQNFPLRAGKGSLYEGGIREPMLVKWPGVVKPGSLASQYVIIEDFFPTILEMARVAQYKAIQPVDGKSFVRILKNPNYADTNRALIWHYPNKWIPKEGDGISWVSAARKGSWKLVYFQKQGRVELYNLENDIEEKNDVKDRYPRKTKEMKELLSRYLQKWKAQMPVFKKTNRKVAFPDKITG